MLNAGTMLMLITIWHRVNLDYSAKTTPYSPIQVDCGLPSIRNVDFKVFTEVSQTNYGDIVVNMLQHHYSFSFTSENYNNSGMSKISFLNIDTISLWNTKLHSPGFAIGCQLNPISYDIHTVLISDTVFWNIHINYRVPCQLTHLRPNRLLLLNLALVLAHDNFSVKFVRLKTTQQKSHVFPK